MNTHAGYSKKTLTNTSVLLAGGGDKSLADFIGSIQYNSTSHKITYTTAAGVSADLVTLITTDENVKQSPLTNNVDRPLMMINGGTTSVEQINTSIFSLGIYANTSTNIITAGGFAKTGSDDNNVLLGGGGHYSLAELLGDHLGNFGGIWHHLQMNNTNDSRANKWYIIAKFDNQNPGLYTAAKVIGYFYKHNANWECAQTYELPFLVMVNFTNSSASFWAHTAILDSNLRFILVNSRCYELLVKEGAHTDFDVFYQVVNAGNGVIYHEGNDFVLGSDGTLVTRNLLATYGNYAYRADVWTTKRTLTIGNSGKEVNGSANVSWTLTEIGIPSWALTSTKPSYSWDEITNKPLSALTGNNGPTWGNFVPVKSDGVMEIGQCLDFHYTSNDGVDYAVRLRTQANSEVIINLPTSSGTMALTSLMVTDVGIGSGNNSKKLYYTLNNTNNYFTVPFATDASTLDGYSIANLFKKSGENLIKGSTFASTTGWGGTGWSGAISTEDATNGIYNFRATNGWWSMYYALPSEYGNTEVTYSFDAKIDSSRTTNPTWTINVGKKNNHESVHDITSQVPTNTWGHVTGTFTTNTIPYFSIVIWGTDSSGNTVWMNVRNLKVEVGKILSCWTPSPSDISKMGWSRLLNVPDLASRWPKWSEVTDKPTALGSATQPVYWNGSGFTLANSYPTKASWNYDDKYVTFVGVTDDTTNHANQLRYIKNAINYYFTPPYASNSGALQGRVLSDIWTPTLSKYWDITLSNSNNWFHIGTFGSTSGYGKINIYVSGNGAPMNNTISVVLTNCGGWSYSRIILCGESTNSTAFTKIAFYNNQSTGTRVYVYLKNTYSESYKYTGYRITVGYGSGYFTPAGDTMSIASGVPASNGSGYELINLSYGHNIIANLIGNATYASSAGTVPWSGVSSTPTTLSGYGITDGYNTYEITGSGNAITTVSASGHKLTFTKGITFSIDGHNHNSSYLSSLAFTSNKLVVKKGDGTTVYNDYVPYAVNADKLDDYHLSSLIDKSGENLILGTAQASTTGWSRSGWGGGISTYDASNGIYKIWSSNGWNTEYYTLNSLYASKEVSFSFDVMFVSSESGEGPSAIYIGSTNNLAGGTDYKPSASNIWLHKKGKLTLGSTPYFAISIRGTDSSGKVCTYRIRNLKVELGDLASVWTPAHGDYLPITGGTVSGNIYALNFYTTSDRNKKTNISSFSEHIRKFQLKDTGKYAYGVIAQEVEEMFRDGEEGNMTVNYNSILSFYIGSLENSVAGLEDAKRLLENRVKMLEDKLRKYEEIQNI